jgi:class 3 adenylate cyclase
VPRRRAPTEYTPRHLADEILTLRSSLVGERKFVTVLFADVVGSMEHADRLGPELWHQTLDRFFRLLAAQIHRLGGTINQFTGDGVMALFGAPIAHEDHAQRACHAALAVVSAMQTFDAAFRERFGAAFEARIGLNSGDVVVGAIGDDLRMDYTAQGHAVGLAARVERLAKPGSVCMTANTAGLVDGYFELFARGEHDLVGSRLPVGVFELRGKGPLRTRLEIAGERGFSPFTGRDDALTSLDRAIELVEADRGLVVGVEGAAGIGKSRLALEFVSRCRGRGVPVYRAHCPSHGRSVPLLPIRELLADFLAVGSDDAPETAHRIEGHPVFEHVDRRIALPVALELLGIESAPPPRALTAAERLDCLSELLVALLNAPVDDKARVVLIDDVHWIDETSETLLERLVNAVPEGRSLLLLNFRPEYRADWMASAHYRELGLTPLKGAPRAALAASLLGDDPALEPLKKQIDRSADGNPLFMEELIRSLADTGILTGKAGAYRVVDPDAPIDVPATLQPILAARIDRLPDADKELLTMAAVVGREFEPAILEAIGDLPNDELHEAIARLESEQLIHTRSLHPDARWSFHHALIRDVAYRSVLQGRREQLHAAVAQAIQSQGAALGLRAGLIAYHWDAAGNRYKAARWRMRATLGVTNIQPTRFS